MEVIFNEVKLSLKAKEGTQGDPNENFYEGEGRDGGRLVQDISIYMSQDISIYGGKSFLGECAMCSASDASNESQEAFLPSPDLSSYTCHQHTKDPKNRFF